MSDFLSNYFSRILNINRTKVKVLTVPFAFAFADLLVCPQFRGLSPVWCEEGIIRRRVEKHEVEQ